jgi:hypothetical protein
MGFGRTEPETGSPSPERPERASYRKSGFEGISQRSTRLQ